MTSRSFLPVVEHDNPPPWRKAIYSASIFQRFQQGPGRFDGGGGGSILLSYGSKYRGEKRDFAGDHSADRRPLTWPGGLLHLRPLPQTNLPAARIRVKYLSDELCRTQANAGKGFVNDNSFKINKVPVAQMDRAAVS